MMAIKGMRVVPTHRRHQLIQVFFLLSATLCPLLIPRSCLSYTPDSPEVREMLDRAMAWLNKSSRSGEAEKLGGYCLLGLAQYKYNLRFGDPSVLPPMTEQGLDKAREKADTLGAVDNYSVGIAAILLCEVHPEEHTDLIQIYLSEILKRQKPHGGWGYPKLSTGDLSQLQYAVLGLWSIKTAGFDVDNKVMADVMNFVIRVQDPSGAWGYQGNDPGTFTRVPQSQVRPSLAAAGLGSLYVGSDFLGMSKKGKPLTIPGGAKKLPAALIPVASDAERRDARSATSLVKNEYLHAAMDAGNRYFEQLPSLKTNLYQYYFLYALERYNSFREKVEGRVVEEPKWYNDGVRLLQENQDPNGFWGLVVGQGLSPTGCDPPVATAFAMLFLLRSTQQTIAKVVERDGILRGGYGLPSDLTDVRLHGNKIVAPAITGEVADLIDMLEDDEGDKVENLLDNPDSLSLSGLEGTTGVEFRDRLTRILRSGTYKTRIVAARTLGRQGSLDNVPVLIYALTDPDKQVMRTAREGLRLISRKFTGFGLPDEPTPSQLNAAVTAWKEWYRSIRPDAVFIQ